jgi:hypothetical protein
MSMRPSEEVSAQEQTAASAMCLRANIDQARAMQAPVTEAAAEGAISFDDLTETEKSAASIGVSPNEWKPIGFMNTHHYSTLLKNNAIAGDLAQGIEAYKQVASGLGSVA